MTPVDSTFLPQAGAVQSVLDDLQAAGDELDAFVNRQLDVLSTIQCQLDEREERLAAFESERATLELELSLARSQLRQQAQERGVWLGELKRMRQSLDRAALEHSALEHSTLDSDAHDGRTPPVEAVEASLDAIVVRLENLQNESDVPGDPRHAVEEICSLDYQLAATDGLAEETTRHE